jgi:hypothetical protein
MHRQGAYGKVEPHTQAGERLVQLLIRIRTRLFGRLDTRQVLDGRHWLLWILHRHTISCACSAACLSSAAAHATCIWAWMAATCSFLCCTAAFASRQTAAHSSDFMRSLGRKV